MARKKPYTPKSFESTGINGDISANLYRSMLLSPAWQDLTAQQKVLYLTCKLQLYGERKKPVSDDELTFTMNKGKWASTYSLYDDNNGRGFRRDLAALIEHGFISCVTCGAITRTKSIYRFSSMWRHYGTETFQVDASELTLSMQRQKRENKE